MLWLVFVLVKLDVFTDCTLPDWVVVHAFSHHELGLWWGSLRIRLEYAALFAMYCVQWWRY